MTLEDKAGFSLKGATGSKFTDVFGSLDTIEAKHNAEEKARSAGEDQRSKYWKDTGSAHDVIDSKNTSRKGRQFGRTDEQKLESKRNASDDKKVDTSCYGPHYRPQFKKPRLPPPRRTTPDYKVHPDKWKCYSLSDVDNSQMNEGANTSAALGFLKDLKKQPMDESNNTEPQGKIMFKNSKVSKTKMSEKSKDQQDSQAEEGRSIGGKLVMPEYNFGTKKKKTGHKTEKDRLSVNSGDKVSLGHLDEECDASESPHSGSEDSNVCKTVETYIFKSKKSKSRNVRSIVDDEDCTESSLN